MLIVVVVVVRDPLVVLAVVTGVLVSAGVLVVAGVLIAVAVFVVVAVAAVADEVVGLVDALLCVSSQFCNSQMIELSQPRMAVYS